VQRNFEGKIKWTLRTYLKLQRSEMICGTQSQYPVKALGILKKVSDFTALYLRK
jgi:hypothetical protein